MGSKLNPGRFDCYANALPDEPMFILLGRDPDAPGLVRRWANGREVAIEGGSRPASDRALVREALECAAYMDTWRAANWPHRRREQTATAPIRQAELAVIAAARELCASGRRQVHDPHPSDELRAELRDAIAALDEVTP